MPQNWRRLCPRGHCPCVWSMLGCKAHWAPARRNGNVRGPGRVIPDKQVGHQLDSPGLLCPVRENLVT